ncbi:MAG: ABC transporter permease [Chitinophagales bacterium]|nr:ABC transporter permease [Chitinophagales bacterium]
MFKYLVNRILLFIPILILISILGFIINVNTPGDPVERLMTASPSEDIVNANTASQQQQRIYWRHRLGLDLPVFYFSVLPMAFPDTLYKIPDKNVRNAMAKLIYAYGNWKWIEQYHAALQELNRAQEEIVLDSGEKKKMSINEIHDAIIESRSKTYSLLAESNPALIKLKIEALSSLYYRYIFLNPSAALLKTVEEKFEKVVTSPGRWENFIPSIHFYSDNQYQRWLLGDGSALTGNHSIYSRGIIRGDLGMSYVTREPVMAEIKKHIGWSLILTLSSVFIAYLISILIGIKAAVRHGSRFDRRSSVILFLLHSMPVFWVATLLLLTFANVELFNWFPASGVKPVTGYPDQSSVFAKIKISLPYLILPLIAYTYSSLAYLSRIVRVAMLDVIHQDYIRTAKAKGLSERAVIYKHALRNAWLPLITVFSNIFPAAVGGSVILETIFTIPGMGLETFQAIQSQNYPVIVGVFTITGIMTLTGYLFADVLYAAADPRISFSAGTS